MALLLRRAAFALGLIVVSACASQTNDEPGGLDSAGAGTSSAGTAGHIGASGGAGATSGGAVNGGSSPAGSAGMSSAGATQSGGGTGGASGAAGSSGGSSTAGTGGVGTSGAGAGGAGGVSGGAAGAGAGAAGKGGVSGSGGSGGSTSAGTGGSGGSAGKGGSAGAGGGAGGCGATLTLVAVADANLNGAAPTTNYGPVAEANIVRGGAAASERAVFSFDLSAVPSGATIKSAQLVLTIVNNPGLDKTIAVHRVAQASNRSWVESEVTWQQYKAGSNWTTPGGDFVAQATDSQAVSGSAPAGSVVTFQVLADAQSFYATPSTNLGFLVKDSLEPGASTGEHLYFATRENATPDYQPKLVLSYCP